jgi:hypothetical protein
MLGTSEGIHRTALLLADGGKEKVIEACVELAKSSRQGHGMASRQEDD